MTHRYPSSPRTPPTYTVSLQVVDNGGAVSAPATRTVLGTATSFGIAKSKSKLTVSGSVGPNRHGHRVIVSLARKRNGSFHTLATHKPTLDSQSRFATSFSRPAAGTCRLTARYPGDSSHLASSRIKTFAC